MVTDANALAQANRPVISTVIFRKVILVKILRMQATLIMIFKKEDRF